MTEMQKAMMKSNPAPKSATISRTEITRLLARVEKLEQEVLELKLENDAVKEQLSNTKGKKK